MCNCGDPNVYNSSTPCGCGATAVPLSASCLPVSYCPPDVRISVAATVDRPGPCQPLREPLLRLLERLRATTPVVALPPPIIPVCVVPAGWPPSVISWRQLADGDCTRPATPVLTAGVVIGAERPDGFVAAEINVAVIGRTDTAAWSVSFDGGNYFAFVADSPNLLLSTQSGIMLNSYQALVKATYANGVATARILVNPLTGEWTIERGVGLSFPAAPCVDNEWMAVLIPEATYITSALATTGDLTLTALRSAVWRVTGGSGRVTGTITARVCGTDYIIPVANLRATGTGPVTTSSCGPTLGGTVTAYKKKDGSYYVVVKPTTIALTVDPRWFVAGLLQPNGRNDRNVTSLTGLSVRVEDACGFALLLVSAIVEPTLPPPRIPFTIDLPVLDCDTGQLTNTSTGGDETSIEWRLVGVRDWAASPTFSIPANLRFGSTINIDARQGVSIVTRPFITSCQVVPPPPPPPPQPLTIGLPVLDCGTGELTNTSAGGTGALQEWRIIGVRDWAASPIFTLLASLRSGSTMNIDVRQGGNIFTRPFTSSCAAPPPPTGALVAALGSYNCITGALVFSYTGGTVSAPEFMAVGITGWTTNPNHVVEAGIRSNPDAQPLILRVRQNGVEGTPYTFDFRAYCAGTNPAPTSVYSVVGLWSTTEVASASYIQAVDYSTVASSGGGGTGTAFVPATMTAFVKTVGAGGVQIRVESYDTAVSTTPSSVIDWFAADVITGAYGFSKTFGIGAKVVVSVRMTTNLTDIITFTVVPPSPATTARTTIYERGLNPEGTIIDAGIING